jgi:hypothetical protein
MPYFRRYSHIPAYQPLALLAVNTPSRRFRRLRQFSIACSPPSTFIAFCYAISRCLVISLLIESITEGHYCPTTYT